ncbi:MAG: pentapeptide repeat-containing protein [Prochlorococcaceae cyanobacterium]
MTPRRRPFPGPFPAGTRRAGMAPARAPGAMLAVASWLGASALLSGGPAVRAQGLPPAQPTRVAGTEALVQLLEQRRCQGCDLAGADLVHAQLADADLSGARLQRANLGQARLDGARLGGADLSFTSLMGASLRGADLRGARLEGTDLRRADLSGALLSPGALSRAHWQGARGIDQGLLSFGELHNAGVEAAQRGRYPEAEQFFSAAIRREPAAGVSWLARAITRSQLGRREEAANDFTYAASLYEAAGEQEQADQLRQAAKQVKAAPEQQGGGGSGVGMMAVSGALGALQFLAPIAAKAFLPLPF